MADNEILYLTNAEVRIEEKGQKVKGPLEKVYVLRGGGIVIVDNEYDGNPVIGSGVKWSIRSYDEAHTGTMSGIVNGLNSLNG